MANSLADITMPPIIAEIARMVMLAPPTTIKRLRFAVSPSEHAAIRKYCLARDGAFYMRIRNVPLIVEEMPDDPDMLVEVV